MHFSRYCCTHPSSPMIMSICYSTIHRAFPDRNPRRPGDTQISGLIPEAGKMKYSGNERLLKLLARIAVRNSKDNNETITKPNPARFIPNKTTTHKLCNYIVTNVERSDTIKETPTPDEPQQFGERKPTDRPLSSPLSFSYLSTSPHFLPEGHSYMHNFHLHSACEIN